VLDNDLNKTIAAAVNAKVEAGVLAALSSDDTIGRFVSAALSERVRDNYSSREETFIGYTVREAIKAATKSACIRLVETEMPAIEEAIRKELRKRIGQISEKMAERLAEQVTGYGLKIEFTDPGRG
jgi:trimethylamine:corrinoid methyltransferase-like protein